ncbi:hypothetical protein EC973_001047 [Apophysomyces ossiformis]|uniref:Homeobox domain-containing protein n=1 Tax=Apophysomyces ossiformis TaxID=679940 RepID=A0A8H7ESC1_9FUNG|nr:hypothetical protein EC973_001047 [Apophysomyces ossiformis]
MDYYWSVTEHKKQASCTSAYQDIASQHPHQQEQEQQQQQQQQQQQRRHYTYSAYSFHANDQDTHIKPKRRRANAIQLEVLNRVFERTFFPSTQTRAELGRQLGMSPRTVQIWFQNRRQAIRMRERQRAEKNQ